MEAIPAMLSIIGDLDDAAFCLSMDDHMGSAKTFEAVFQFLHTKYLPRVAFGSVYLSGHKTQVFTDSLGIGLSRSRKG